MTDNDLTRNDLKAQFYFDKKITVHVETYDDKFYNGLILEISKEFIVLNDRVLREIPIPFSNIKELERFREKNTEEVSND